MFIPEGLCGMVELVLADAPAAETGAVVVVVSLRAATMAGSTRLFDAATWLWNQR
jgi:hypothetical protein